MPISMSSLATIMSRWLFSKWKIDPLGLFPFTLGQVKYLIVVIDYFIKWVKAEPLSTITTAQARKFVWRNIFTRFRIPDSMVTNNGMQFINRSSEISSQAIRWSITLLQLSTHRLMAKLKPPTRSCFEAWRRGLMKPKVHRPTNSEASYGHTKQPLSQR